MPPFHFAQAFVKVHSLDLCQSISKRSLAIGTLRLWKIGTVFGPMRLLAGPVNQM